MMKIIKAIISIILAITLCLVVFISMFALGWLGHDYFITARQIIDNDPMARRLGDDCVIREIKNGRAITSPIVSAKDDLPQSNVGDAVIANNASVERLIKETAERYDVSAELALAIAEAESDFRNICNEKYGCSRGIGVYQIGQTTFDEQCEGNIFENKNNIDCAISMMSQNQYWRWKQSYGKWKDIADIYGVYLD